MSGLVPISDVAIAAYCPRQLYYVRRADDRSVPDRVAAVRDLSFRYPSLLAADDATLAGAPIDVPPETYRANLRTLREREDWEALVDPAEERVTVAGRDCRGVVHKVLEGPVPVVASAGAPPERGAWETDAVRAVAAAMALAARESREVDRALVEYPAHGVVRAAPPTGRRRAAYRRALRAARSLDGPPPRIDDDAKCGACDYRERCGVRSRSLRSLL